MDEATRRAASAAEAAKAADALVRRLTPADSTALAPLPCRPDTCEQAQGKAADARARAEKLAAQQQEVVSQQEVLQELIDFHAAVGQELRNRHRELDLAFPDAKSADAPALASLRADLVLDIEVGDDAALETAKHGWGDVNRRLAERVERAIGSHRQAAEAVETAGEKVARAVGELRQLGNRADFKDIPQLMRNRVLAADTEELVQRAPELAEDLRLRAQLMAQKLADLDEDVIRVLDRLAKAAGEVLADLAKVERYARMPSGTGSWSDRSFLTIRMPSLASQEELRARLRPVLEGFSVNPDHLTPMRLLKECVAAAAGGPQAIRVRVLKPAEAPAEPQDITKLQKFSGGEKLTICVALYCLMARLRQRNAGRNGGGGTLILDNPLGTASHIALLGLQRRVATAHGVQLVFATGVNDLAAVGEFPHQVRLKNVHRPQVGRAYVEVDDPGITAAHVGQVRVP